MARTQTMVQLSDELVGALDDEAARRGVSRSALIRKALEGFLAEGEASTIGRRIVEGYQRIPQATPDEWGDATALGDHATGDLLVRLDAEERDAGHPPW